MVAAQQTTEESLPQTPDSVIRKHKTGDLENYIASLGMKEKSHVVVAD